MLKVENKFLPLFYIFLITFCLFQMLTPDHLIFVEGETKNFCTTLLHPKISVVQGLLCETIATGILIFVICAASDSRNAKNVDSLPIRLGLVVTLLCIIFAPYTGCSINPARSLGPAIINNQWEHHWVYWLGPITGSVIASLSYKTFYAE